MLAFDQLSFWEKETYTNHADVIIIGSGIVGLSTAIHVKMAHPSKQVLVLERSYLPFGASTKNAGFACIGSPSELLDDLSRSSEQTVFETVQKRWEGLQYLKELLGADTIDYQENGSYELFAPHQKELHQQCIESLPYLNRRLASITGKKEVFQADSKIIFNNGFHGFTAAISHQAEGQIDTGKMMHAFIQKAIQLGVHILNGIAVKSILKEHIITDHGNIPYQQVAICTNGFAQHLLPDEDIQPARAQVLVTSPVKNLKFKGIYHFDEGYYYFRNVGNRILFGGGRNLDKAKENTTKAVNTPELIQHLQTILNTQILPHKNITIEHQWAGIMGVGQTKVPIIKKIDSGQFSAIRLGGMGVAIGALVGKQLASLMNK